MWEFRSLQISLLLCSFVAVVGGAFFLATALFIEKDRDLAENYVPSGEWGYWWNQSCLRLEVIRISKEFGGFRTFLEVLFVILVFLYFYAYYELN